MAKQSGLGDALYVSGYDLSGDTGGLSAIKQPRALLDITGINKLAHERIHGLADGEISFEGFFNDSALQEHAALSGLSTADAIASYFRGTTQGGWTANVIAKQVNYDVNRGTDGSMTVKTQVLANGYGLEWGQSLTAGQRTDTSATAPATGTDQTVVSTAFGCAAYLHVFSFAGTSATMTIQDSADNAAFANITGLSAFTAATGRTFQRIETDTLARTIRRYVKVNTTGTFSSCVFAVTFVRYQAALRAS